MQYEVGQILEGKIKGIKNFGAFVELPNGESGLVHISQVSESYVNKIEDYLSEGQDVKVKVLGIEELENGKKKISLSIRQATASQARSGTQNKNNASWKDSKKFAAFNRNEKSRPHSFEDMMAKFKKESDEKMTDLSQRMDFK